MWKARSVLAVFLVLGLYACFVAPSRLSTAVAGQQSAYPYLSISKTYPLSAVTTQTKVAPVTPTIYTDKAIDARLVGMLLHVKWLLNEQATTKTQKELTRLNEQVLAVMDDVNDDFSDVRDDIDSSGLPDGFVINDLGQVTAGTWQGGAISDTYISDILTIGTSSVFANDIMTPDAILSTGQTDEYCLTYEGTGTTFEWQSCSSGGGLAATDIDTSAELATILTDETGSGAVVFSTDPTFTGTVNAAAATLSSTLTLSGTAANIALGSNWLSGDGSDEGVYVASSGNVGIGTNNPLAKVSIIASSTGTQNTPNTGSALHVTGEDGLSTAMTFDAFGSDFYDSPYITLRKANGTSASPSATEDSDILGNLQTFGYEGGSFQFAADIAFLATENWTSSARGSAVVLNYGRAGATTRAAAYFRENGLAINKGAINPAQYSQLDLAATTLSAPSWTTAGININSRAATFTDTSGAGTIATRVGSSFGIPTFASSNGVTVTNAATLYVAGAPTAGTNTTLTNRHALHVAAGNSYFAGSLGIGTTSPSQAVSVGATTNSQFLVSSTGVISDGTWQGDVISSTYLDTAAILSTEIDSSSELATLITDETGTGNIVFSASPTFTGTLAAAAADFSGIVDFGSTAYISSNGIFRTVLGTAPSPAYSFENDTDSGFYSPGDGAIRFSSNNSDVLSIASGGNIGVATTTALYRFATVGTSLFQSTGQVYNWTNGSTPATALMRLGLDSNGNGLVIKAPSGGSTNRLLSVHDQFGTTLFSVSGSGVSFGGSGRISMDAGLVAGTSLNLSGIGDRAVIGSSSTSSPALLIVDDRTAPTTERTVPLMRFAFNDSPVNAQSTGGINAISGNSNRGLAFYSYATSSASFVENMRLFSSGNVAIGTSTAAQKLQVFGNIRVGTSGSNGCIEDYGGGVIGGTCSSDQNLKTNITPLAQEGRSYIEGLAALTPVSYNWNQAAAELYRKDLNTENLGLIAQDVESQFPELVSENDDGYKQVDFRSLPFYIIEALKELWQKVQGHDERLQELEQENQLLKNRIEEIEDELDISAPPPPAEEPPAPEGGGGEAPPAEEPPAPEPPPAPAP